VAAVEPVPVPLHEASLAGVVGAFVCWTALLPAGVDPESVVLDVSTFVCVVELDPLDESGGVVALVPESVATGGVVGDDADPVPAVAAGTTVAGAGGGGGGLRGPATGPKKATWSTAVLLVMVTTSATNSTAGDPASAASTHWASPR
jgi:hypothetical protein